MAQKYAFIRCDASAEIGLGHLARCATLAHELVRHGWKIKFFSYFVPEHPWASQPSPFEIEWVPEISSQLSGQCDLLVVDNYQLSAEWEKANKKYTKYLVVLDDLANRPHDCDLLLDQNYRYESVNPYKEIANAKTYLLGPEYALLKPEFVRQRPLRKNTNFCQQGLMFFGGTDPRRAILKYLPVIINTALEWHVVLTTSCLHLSEVKQALAGHSRIRLQIDLPHLADLMKQTDIFVGAGGTVSWERISMRIPSLCIAVAENQVPASEALHKAGAHYYLGEFASVSEELVARELELLISSSERRNAMVESMERIIRGNPLEKVVNCLESFL